MLAQRGDRAVVRHGALREEAHAGDHRQAAVLDLLQLQLLDVALGIAQRVEGAARVQALLAALGRALLVHEADGGQLDHGQQAQVGHASGVAQVGGRAAVDGPVGRVHPAALASQLHREHASGAQL